MAFSHFAGFCGQISRFQQFCDRSDTLLQELQQLIEISFVCLASAGEEFFRRFPH